MMKLFDIEKKPHKGLLTIEWLIMGYLVLTLLLVLFTYTKQPNPNSLIWGRIQVVALTAAMWGVYRLLPCRFTMLCRIGAQLALLSWWYPDTYELNKIFPNLDHHFAALDQQLFGCQPALLFSEKITNGVFSELIYLGYTSYYPLIAAVTLYYFFKRNQEFQRTVFVILGAFFLYYLIFVFLPVTGPQYYYGAVGLDQIAQGNFPDVGNYFATHNESLKMPGYSEGLIYQAYEGVHLAGERPTAAFPSSHVGICTVLVLLAWRARSKMLFYGILPFYILMTLATVYIRAHYVVDVFGGWVSGAVFYFALQAYWTHSKRTY